MSMLGDKKIRLTSSDVIIGILINLALNDDEETTI